MAEPKPGSTAIDVGSVRVSGLATPAKSGEMRRGVEAALGEQLAAASATGSAQHVAIDRLKLRLPHTANAKDVAQALSRAIARGLRGGRP
ncbi:MAG: hypothetical protein AB7P52_03710 [Alphaproteobacteria bacterium]